MSKLTKEEILKLAFLARLKLSDDEVEKYQKELSSILDYVKHLDNVDVSGLEPTYQVSGLVNVSRKDQIIDYGVSNEELLKNVPVREGVYIKVRRMI
ncbi:MAG: Asp-tRNA(Asn)/Glu-tRNA(Gln) amidotransferase subunit GatC [bacterium]